MASAEMPSAALRGHNYKALKEAFVSNLSGGTILEVNLVTLVAPAAILLWSVLQSRYHLFRPYNAQAAMLEAFLNCGAILAAITIYASQPVLLNALLIGPAIFVFLSEEQVTSSPTRRQAAAAAVAAASSAKEVKSTTTSVASNASTKDVAYLLPIKPFVTMYRGGMMIITCAAILAVDFRLFPRRFAKVETWGTSLMDMGVGSFVFAAGVTSARGILKDRLSGRSSSQGLSQRMRDAIRHSLPLLVLGVIRFLSVKGVDYAEHVTEYGVHWNFFFTLGFLPPFMAVLNTLFMSVLPSYEAMALLIGVLYELALNYGGLIEMVVKAPRTTLFLQNREGILSFAGYLAVFLAGQGCGMYVLPRDGVDEARSKTKPSTTPIPSPSSDPPRTTLYLKTKSFLTTTVAGRLLTWTIIYSTLFLASTSYTGFNLRVSRRLANLPYILWVSSFNTSQLLLLSGIEALCCPGLYSSSSHPDTSSRASEAKRLRNATSTVMHAFNRNGLAIFLVANLLTGLVNLGINTLEVGRLGALVVLVGYMGVLTGLALGLDARGISIKL